MRTIMLCGVIMIVFLGYTSTVKELQISSSVKSLRIMTFNDVFAFEGRQTRRISGVGSLFTKRLKTVCEVEHFQNQITFWLYSEVSTFRAVVGITDICCESTKKKLCNKFLRCLNKGVNTCINTRRPFKANFELPDATRGPRKTAGDKQLLWLLMTSIETVFLVFFDRFYTFGYRKQL